ncbi:hypothetical protein PCANC_25553 [Puccinia coronata f. sp. avenae]|uniref:RxLR effector protein n=1 Tax=Puccinia coronata f. sp. avenae TaxID=200324 RepID=A0A2N5S105_9BASI|nr:hypothetical protein PCANC_25553 [Puccinia coronata f. sp. avenae]
MQISFIFSCLAFLALSHQALSVPMIGKYSRILNKQDRQLKGPATLKTSYDSTSHHEENDSLLSRPKKKVLQKAFSEKGPKLVADKALRAWKSLRSVNLRSRFTKDTKNPWGLLQNE